MSDERSADLIRELVSDLEPVRPIPRLRVVLGTVLALWMAVAAVGLALLGLRPDLGHVLGSQLGVVAVYAGLVVAGLGGLVAALAIGVPGREAAVRFGLALGATGMALAAGLGTLLFVRSPATELRAPYAGDLHCLAVACTVAILPALGVIAFAGRALPRRPLMLVLAAAAGTAALGAVTAQASCPYAGFRHLLMGHVLAPGAGALLLTLPLLFALKRLGR